MKICLDYYYANRNETNREKQSRWFYELLDSLFIASPLALFWCILFRDNQNECDEGVEISVVGRRWNQRHGAANRRHVCVTSSANKCMQRWNEDVCNRHAIESNKWNYNNNGDRGCNKKYTLIVVCTNLMTAALHWKWILLFFRHGEQNAAWKHTDRFFFSSRWNYINNRKIMVCVCVCVFTQILLFTISKAKCKAFFQVER